MKKITIVVLALAVVVSGSVSCAEYKYVNYSVRDDFEGGKSVFVLDTATKEIRSSDVIDSVSLCKDAEKFICFHANWVDFYLPKEGILVGDKWSHEDVKFEVLRTDSLDVLGVSKKVLVIRSIRSGLRKSVQFFYYSDVDGLLAIKDVEVPGGKVLFFVVAGEVGFPR
jgi:hypothetical protein